MLPVVAIVGRANVGKSTLFNTLIKQKRALVLDLPGTTRDCQYTHLKNEMGTILLVDTGNITTNMGSIESQMKKQSLQAIEEAQLLLFMVDAKVGIISQDEFLLKKLHRTKKEIWLIVNKIDGVSQWDLQSRFYNIYLRHYHHINAQIGKGVGQLRRLIFKHFITSLKKKSRIKENGSIKIAIIGRPNVGKSTLINRILGEERVIVTNNPGTTRDSIYLPFLHGNTTDKSWTIIDTAGIRRQGSICEQIERLSVLQAFQAIEKSQVVVFVLDANTGIVDQDMRLLHYIAERGTALVIAYNKWDITKSNDKAMIGKNVKRSLSMFDYAIIRNISAKYGTGVVELLREISQAYDAASSVPSTHNLNDILKNLLARHIPPIFKGRRIKLRYAHCGGKHPLRIIIHGNQVDCIPENYARYLSRGFRKALDLKGAPLWIEFKNNKNPYDSENH